MLTSKIMTEKAYLAKMVACQNDLLSNFDRLPYLYWVVEHTCKFYHLFIFTLLFKTRCPSIRIYKKEWSSKCVLKILDCKHSLGHTLFLRDEGKKQWCNLQVSVQPSSKWQPKVKTTGRLWEATILARDVIDTFFKYHYFLVRPF